MKRPWARSRGSICSTLQQAELTSGAQPKRQVRRFSWSLNQNCAIQCWSRAMDCVSYLSPAAYDLLMKLKQSNPYLKSAAARKAALRISAQTSSAVEGIHAPFLRGKDTKTPASTEAFITHWKRRASSVR